MTEPKPYDYLIVGAGLAGATLAYFARQKGLRCLIIDKRPNIGGNLFCENTEGINVHKYGAHIFHTSDEEVWSLVNSLTPFNNFINSPIACAPDGNLYNLPFNMNTFSRLWGIKTPEEAIRIIEAQKAEVAERLRANGHANPSNLEEQALSLVGRDIYELLIKGYTEKQWGRKCVDLPAFIIKRLPVRFTFDNNYFTDKYQGIPVGGYNVLIDRLTEGIETRTSTDFFENRELFEKISEKIIFTGPLDQFYDYRFGKLEYRTVSFDTQTLDQPNFQGNAVVNYTGRDVPFTRIIEHKHFEMFGAEVYSNPHTVISHEYPSEWRSGADPYYPVNDARNEAIVEKYKALARQEKRVIFAGRLAEYKYYDMAPLMRNMMDLQESL